MHTQKWERAQVRADHNIGATVHMRKTMLKRAKKYAMRLSKTISSTSSFHGDIIVLLCLLEISVSK